MSKPPLWKEIDRAWWSLVNTDEPHCDPPASDQAACVIRAVRDWLGRCGSIPWGARVVMCRILTAEADRAERGEVEHG